MENPIKAYKIAEIKLLEFFLKEPLFEYDPLKINFNIDIMLRLVPQKEKIICSTRITVTVKHGEVDFLMSVLHTAFAFETIGLKDIAVKNAKMQFPKGFITTLISLSFSTARGVLFAKGLGSALQFLLLPVVQPSLLKYQTVLQENENEEKDIAVEIEEVSFDSN
jgi:hypothetical protein